MYGKIYIKLYESNRIFILKNILMNKIILYDFFFKILTFFSIVI